jgi:hypothetical protein
MPARARSRSRSVAPRIVLVGLLAVAVLYGWRVAHRALRTPAADAPRVAFEVDGRDCPGWCAVRLTESIDCLDGAEVEVLDQKNGKVVVRHDPNRQNVDALRDLRDLLDRRGFAVRASAPVDR